MLKNLLTTSLFLIISWLSVFFVYAQPPGGGFGGPASGNGQTEWGSSLKRQSPPSPGKIADQETYWMMKKLKLRAHQIPAIEDLNFQYAVTRAQMMQQFMQSAQIPAQGDFEKMKTGMETLQVEKEQKLQLILTEEQWIVYQKKKKNLNQISNGKRPPMGGGVMR